MTNTHTKVTKHTQTRHHEQICYLLRLPKLCFVRGESIEEEETPAQLHQSKGPLVHLIFYEKFLWLLDIKHYRVRGI